MNRFAYKHWVRAIVIFTNIFLVSCATVSKVHPPFRNENGTLRVAQVMQLATRQEIIGLGVHYKHLLASGIKDSDLRDRSLAVGRVYCCGGPPEEGMAIWFYVPEGLTIDIGDIVEIRMGRQPSKCDPGAVNTAVQVRQKKDDVNGPCRWIPPDPKLWMRVLYCDWMEKEGWIEKGGRQKTWLKPAPAKGGH